LSWSKFSLDTAYDEAKDYVFSTDDHYEQNGCILAFNGKKETYILN